MEIHYGSMLMGFVIGATVYRIVSSIIDFRSDRVIHPRSREVRLGYAGHFEQNQLHISRQLNITQ